MRLDEFIANSSVLVKKGSYAYVKASRKPAGSHFAVIEDENEITVITKEPEKVNALEEPVLNLLLIEFCPTIPFKGVGFIAAIADALAKKQINVLVVSTFSKDYFLVPQTSGKSAIAALRRLGFKVRAEKYLMQSATSKPASGPRAVR